MVLDMKEVLYEPAGRSGQFLHDRFGKREGCKRSIRVGDDGGDGDNPKKLHVHVKSSYTLQS